MGKSLLTLLKNIASLSGAAFRGSSLPQPFPPGRKTDHGKAFLIHMSVTSLTYFKNAHTPTTLI